MQFSEYQKEARRTDHLAVKDEREALLVPLLGLAGESGQLVSEFKKYFISGDDDRAHFTSIVKEELGDVLWYVSTIADRFGMSLDDVAFSNLVKVQNRWPLRTGEQKDEAPTHFLFDSDYPSHEQLPRTMILKFEDAEVNARKVVRISFADGSEAGNKLTDNAYAEDGYRFHDVFHIAYAGHLGWSPVLRSLWKRKRKSKPRVDEVEDGGRAVVIEEGIAALVFSDAQDRGFYEGSDKIDSSLLRVIKNMTSHLEVSVRSYREWQNAILDGYRVFRQIRENNGGYVRFDLTERTVEFQGAL